MANFWTTDELFYGKCQVITLKAAGSNRAPATNLSPLMPVRDGDCR